MPQWALKQRSRVGCDRFSFREAVPTAGYANANATTLAQEGATTIVNGRTQERGNAAILLHKSYANDHIKQSIQNAKLQGIAADLGTIAGVEFIALA
jgi:hypothetical protein